MNASYAYLFRKEGLFLGFIFHLNLWSTAIIDYLKVKVESITNEPHPEIPRKLQINVLHILV